jgi:hypothetical protein
MPKAIRARLPGSATCVVVGDFAAIAPILMLSSGEVSFNHDATMR